MPRGTRTPAKIRSANGRSPSIVPRAIPGPSAEWEQMKARCRNLSPHDAVMECAYLSAQYREMWRSMSPVQPDFRQIILALQAKKVPFVLTGAYGISTWTGRPRATHDVDILVKAGRNQARAVNALKALYPALEVRTSRGVVGFFMPGETESVIDVTYPHRADNEVTLQTAIWIEKDGLEYRIPALEAALANKYGASLHPYRDAGKRARIWSISISWSSTPWMRDERRSTWRRLPIWARKYGRAAAVRKSCNSSNRPGPDECRRWFRRNNPRSNAER